jgi:hypothetical protein
MKTHSFAFDADVLGAVGSKPLHALLTSTRKLERKRAVNQIVRLLTIGQLLPKNYQVLGVAVGADSNGDAILYIQAQEDS